MSTSSHPQSHPAAPQGDPQSHPNSPGGSEAATVLLVDDDPAKRFGLESVLSSLPIRLVLAANAREALKHLLREQFTMMILDVKLPEMNGFELAELIRQRPRYQSTPIVFVSAIDEADAKQMQGRDLGPVEFIPTPIVPSAFRAKVMALCESGAAPQGPVSQPELKAEPAPETPKIPSTSQAYVHELEQKLEQANREMEAFMYSVSHDVRSPLKTAQSFCGLLREESAGAMSEQGLEFLKYMEAALQKADQMVSAMLALSRITRAPFNRQDVDLVDLARSILPELDQQRLASVTLTLPETLPVQGDPDLLGNALKHLLENALKFTSLTEDGRVELGRDMDENNGSVHFIRDNGAGFAPHLAEKLFIPFQRVHTKDEFPGAGVGLATVQRVIARHEGRVWIKAQPNQGATVYFVLPQQEQALV